MRSAPLVVIMRFSPVRFSLEVSSQGISDFYSALDYLYSFTGGPRSALGTRQSLI